MPSLQEEQAAKTHLLQKIQALETFFLFAFGPASFGLLVFPSMFEDESPVAAALFEEGGALERRFPLELVSEDAVEVEGPACTCACDEDECGPVIVLLLLMVFSNPSTCPCSSSSCSRTRFAAAVPVADRERSTSTKGASTSAACLFSSSSGSEVVVDVSMLSRLSLSKETMLW